VIFKVKKNYGAMTTMAYNVMHYLLAVFMIIPALSFPTITVTPSSVMSYRSLSLPYASQTTLKAAGTSTSTLYDLDHDSDSSITESKMVSLDTYGRERSKSLLQSRNAMTSKIHSEWELVSFLQTQPSRRAVEITNSMDDDHNGSGNGDHNIDVVGVTMVVYHAAWCKSCQKFQQLLHRYLRSATSRSNNSSSNNNNNHGDQRNNISDIPPPRCATVEFGLNKHWCQMSPYNVKRLPTVHYYDASSGQYITGFAVGPKKFSLVTDTYHRLVSERQRLVIKSQNGHVQQQPQQQQQPSETSSIAARLHAGTQLITRTLGGSIFGFDSSNISSNDSFLESTPKPKSATTASWWNVSHRWEQKRKSR
jgi:hypothetical protein